MVMPVFEFHISRQSRDFYKFDEALFSINGNVIFANFRAAREFAYQMNAKKDLLRFPEQAVRASEINAMGLIDEILHFVVNQYRKEINPELNSQAVAWLVEQICPGSNYPVGKCDALERTLYQFASDFPPVKVYRKEESLADYFEGTTENIPNRQILLEELIMLWLENVNPAFSPYLELFDDTELKRTTLYGDQKPSQIISLLYRFFENQPRYGPDKQNLIDMLRSPAIAAPHSLTGQLEYILSRWRAILGDRFLYRLLGSLDLIKEETKIIFGVGDGGVAQVYDFSGIAHEPERFSPDRDWMPSLVMIAKHTFVWLSQLSDKYQRAINRLDQIPDEELDLLKRWGFGGLWLIGVWERSSASQKIKQWTGNPEAMASAYSLYDYQIAAELGGDEAYHNLKERAWQRGIRLGADMVPNHTGIYSKWIVEHPDWFVSLPYSPFPSYSFNTGNLSNDQRVGVYLDEHYYSRTDAAVVFKRIDHHTGEEIYIYHGNDGTSMPWNDTAQLNYLDPQVREAIIQSILNVARRFSIIRFDAAMTLTKLHYQRLWYPEPGTGGAIPSRAEHGLTKAQFNQAMPEEFWRQVVDRVAQEVPDTLLLAEAFWLLEGFFVRTLGMHRVYNSAFMNMLRDEKNDEYRQVIKNTIEFDPEILKRYVNFMNNPDERTAVDQFGKGDKYFGIALMMATMPGLPMFGHGQVEGYTEKYGMEYRRAYWDETPDVHLVERHEHELAPLLHKRYLFAHVDDFLLYDFYSTHGTVDENVFAYSNSAADQHVLVIYHNKFSDTRGWIRTSAAYSIKSGGGDDRHLVQRSLAEGLGLRKDAHWYAIFRDHKSGLEFIRNNQKLHDEGLYVELGAYQYQVFLDFRQVEDDEYRQYSHLETYLNGKGVPDIDEAVKQLFLQPIHSPFKDLINAGQFDWLQRNLIKTIKPNTAKHLAPILDEEERKVRSLFEAIWNFSKSQIDNKELREAAAQIRRETEVIMYLVELDKRQSWLVNPHRLPWMKYLPTRLGEKESAGNLKFTVLFLWASSHLLGKTGNSMRSSGDDYPMQARALMDEWMLNKLSASALMDMGFDEISAWQIIRLNGILVFHQAWFTTNEDADPAIHAMNALRKWLMDPEVQRMINVNRYKGVLWFNKEAFEQYLAWLFTIALIQVIADHENTEKLNQQIAQLTSVFDILLKAEKRSAFQVERLIDSVITEK